MRYFVGPIRRIFTEFTDANNVTDSAGISKHILLPYIADPTLHNIVVGRQNLLLGYGKMMQMMYTQF